MKDLYPEYIQNSLNSAITIQNNRQKFWTETALKKIYRWQLKLEKMQTSLIIRGMQVKTKWDTHYPPFKQHKLKRVIFLSMIRSVGAGVLTYYTSGNVKWNNFGK